MSIELSLEDVKKVALHYGFQLEVILVYVLFACLSKPWMTLIDLLLIAEGKGY